MTTCSVSVTGTTASCYRGYYIISPLHLLARQLVRTESVPCDINNPLRYTDLHISQTLPKTNRINKVGRPSLLTSHAVINFQATYRLHWIVGLILKLFRFGHTDKCIEFVRTALLVKNSNNHVISITVTDRNKMLHKLTAHSQISVRLLIRQAE